MASRRITYLGESLEIAYLKHPSTAPSQTPRNIVFLHGWGSHKELMHQAFAKSFADYTHYYIDLPGFGASPYGEELDFLDSSVARVDSSEMGAQGLKILDTSDYAHIVLAFLHSLGISADIIIGHSFGGKVAVMCAKIDSGAKVGGCLEGNDRSAYDAAKDLSQKAKSTIKQPTPNTIGEIILLSSAGIVRKKSFKVRAKIICAKLAKLAHIRLPFLRASDARRLNPTMYEVFKTIVDEDFSQVFAACRTRVQIFWGRDDRDTPLESGEKIHALIPDSRLFVLEGGHYFFINQAARIESMYKMQARHIRVYGKVQGVGYRKFAKVKADELSLYGSTQNLCDGSVEIFACGGADSLEQFLQALRIGPSRAEVQEVRSEPCALRQEWLESSAFRILIEES